MPHPRNVVVVLPRRNRSGRVWQHDPAAALVGCCAQEEEAWATFVAALAAVEDAVDVEREGYDPDAAIAAVEAARNEWARLARAKHLRAREAVLLLGLDACARRAPSGRRAR